MLENDEYENQIESLKQNELVRESKVQYIFFRTFGLNYGGISGCLTSSGDTLRCLFRIINYLIIRIISLRTWKYF